ncbi:polyribonucleotide nucleotidyltransferase [Candidatus Dependentiae bacterium]|nr:polyribonucleotide nucleotidyltransferase [Candidatus Dependentiae bacterium]
MEKFTTEINGHPLEFETGFLAKQADGSIIVRYLDTVILVTAVMGKTERPDIDFFPLSVEFKEKTFAAGKIPGGFFKREGRPSELEILSSRLVDRSLRPLFPQELRNEIQIIVSVLSYDSNALPDVLGLSGASAALMISGIPFAGPVAAVRIGYDQGNYFINPSWEEKNSFELDLIVAGGLNSVTMIEGSGAAVSEDVVLEAVNIASKEIKKICETQLALKEACAKPPIEYTPFEMDPQLIEEIKQALGDQLKGVFEIEGKLNQEQKERDILKTLIDKFVDEDDKEKKKKINQVTNVFNERLKDEMRRRIFDEHLRPDNRKADEIREIYSVVGFLPRTHGSAVFQRGETQALATVTLGSAFDEQIIDGLDEEKRRKFLLHYNFPPFSVGEARPLRGPGRREIGHGVLAKKSLSYIMPDEEEFPYTVRIVSEILESNGSSSMATVCGGCLALMDAGVPIKKPVAGIALGLIFSDDKFEILSDIAGMEDHFGDMDFKVAGTEDGITAIQLDIKIQGLTMEILSRGLEQAKQGRLHILGKMSEALPQTREALSVFAPKILIMSVPKEKIGEVIGPGGRVIKEMTALTEANINIDDDGKIKISGLTTESIESAKEMIERIVKGVNVGEVYEGVVDRIEGYGCFVSLAPNVGALLHISELEHGRTGNVTDVVKLGEKIQVKVIDVDSAGRIKVSRKALIDNPNPEKKDYKKNYNSSHRDNKKHGKNFNK